MSAMKKKTADALADYRAKRTSDATPEPAGAGEGRRGGAGAPRFVVQKHDARRLHFDLRLEVDGVLWSWAVPHGPSRDPAEKRLAVRTEDHPLEYADFEDVIPEGNYGAGAMIVWDQGVYAPLLPMDEGLAKGKLLFELRGHKLRGAWTLVKLKKAEEDAWLLIKERDGNVAEGPDAFADDSVLSGLTVETLGAGGDPAAAVRAELERLGAPERVLDPRRTELMLAEAAERPFTRDGWVFEFKYDGYRALAFREDDDVRLLSRRGNDMAGAFPDLVAALARLPWRRFLLDGEIVVHDDAGLPSFQRLQRRAGLRRATDVRRAAIELPATLWLFDLLGFEDRDVRALPLTDRKALLRRLLPSVGTLRFSEHIPTHGEALYAQAERVGVEGIIAKKADAPYRAGRSAEWVKVRLHRSDDFVIVGWTAPKRGRPGFGALHVAQQQGKRLRWAGQVGSGFTEKQLNELRAAVESAQRKTPPCVGAPKGAEHAWTRPALVCEVRYLERTEEGLLRQPVFLRTRTDKEPSGCVWPEEPGVVARDIASAGDSADIEATTNPEDTSDGADTADAEDTANAQGSAHAGDTAQAGDTASAASGEIARAVRFTNLDKPFWPEDGYTKGDLIAFYRAVSPWMLPFLRDRPLVLTRYPDGIHGKSFFQKDAPSFAPSWLRTTTLRGEGGERDLSYFVADDEATLLYVANSGAIVLHVWPSRVATLERPDWCILDLDPKEAPFAHVVRVARAARALCEEIGLPVHVKSSGSSGLHLLVPVGRLLDHEQTKTLGELLARVLAKEMREIATITRAVERRGGKVYIDYLQNGRGKLLVAPYSVRPLPGAPVSVPLLWSEVEEGLDIRRFTIRTVLPRLEKMKEDPLLPVLGDAPDLMSALEALQARF